MQQSAIKSFRNADYCWKRCTFIGIHQSYCKYIFRQNNIARWNIKIIIIIKKEHPALPSFALSNPSMHARTLSSKLWFPVFQEIHLTWKSSLFSNSNARLAAGFYSGIWGAATKRYKLSPAFVSAQQLRIWPVPRFIPNPHYISPDLFPSSPSHLHTTDIQSTHTRRKSVINR